MHVHVRTAVESVSGYTCTHIQCSPCTLNLERSICTTSFVRIVEDRRRLVEEPRGGVNMCFCEGGKRKGHSFMHVYSTGTCTCCTHKQISHVHPCSNKLQL